MDVLEGYLISQKSVKHLTTSFATGMGAFGGFPTPPKIFQDWLRNPYFQWFLVFVLIWQGGGGGADFTYHNIVISIGTTFILYIAKQFLDSNYDKLKKMGL
jgi:hypothetical protein